MRSFWAEVWAGVRPIALWGLFVVLGALAVKSGHGALGVALLAFAGLPLFSRGFRFGVGHERRRQALAAKELDVDLEEEPAPEVPAVTSDGQPLH